MLCTDTVLYVMSVWKFVLIATPILNMHVSRKMKKKEVILEEHGHAM